jgi:DNA mismatch endonuclease (patch repair protein)
MAAVRHKGTAPELLVRKVLHRLGYRFRLHVEDLPGSPDIVFPRRKKVIFIHGCFWHGHDCAHGRRRPRTNQAYWQAKIERNRLRDSLALGALAEKGWATKVLWECDLSDPDRLIDHLMGFLGPSRRP